MGGPGTGKSVIALNLVAGALPGWLRHPPCDGIEAVTENVRKKVGTKATPLFKYFNSYLGADTDTLDVLVCDEAHRIRQVSHTQYTPKGSRTDKPQVDESHRCRQGCSVLPRRPTGSSPRGTGEQRISFCNAADRVGAPVFSYELEAQFRCGGSDGFVQWVDNTLEIRKTPTILFRTRRPV